MTALDQSCRFPAIHAQELDSWQKFFHLQTAATQDFLEKQVSWLAWAMINDLPQVCFWLPECVTFEQDGTGLVKTGLIPDIQRHQKVINRYRRLTHMTLCAAVQQRFAELEMCPDEAVVIGAGLIRFSCSMYLVHRVVHSCWMDTCIPDNERTFPAFMPRKIETLSFSVESGAHFSYKDHTSKDVPRSRAIKPVEGSRQHGVPQKRSVVEECQPVLALAVDEAEKLIAILQQDLLILDIAVASTPYIVAEEDFQQKRYWIIGQLIQQGRALAQFQVKEIIHSIQQRAAENLLNRGLSLSLPYFDDHALKMRSWDFQVIPAGRTLFSPAFVVRAVWLEQVKLSWETRLSPSTRKHLLEELGSLERAFDSAAGS